MRVECKQHPDNSRKTPKGLLGHCTDSVTYVHACKLLLDWWRQTLVVPVRMCRQSRDIRAKAKHILQVRPGLASTSDIVSYEPTLYQTCRQWFEPLSHVVESVLTLPPPRRFSRCSPRFFELFKTSLAYLLIIPDMSTRSADRLRHSSVFGRLTVSYVHQPLSAQCVRAFTGSSVYHPPFNG